MARTPLGTYSPIPPDPEKLNSLLAMFATKLGIKPSEVRILVHYEFDDGGTDDRKIEPAAVAALVPVAPPISIVSFYGADFSGPSFSIYVEGDHVGIRAGADTMMLAKEIVDNVVETLALTTYESPEDVRVSALEKRLDEVQAREQNNVRLRCFLSFRFSAPDDSLAAQVERFLQLQNVDVVTGRSYEPRRIEDKVLSRLAQPLDFVVFLLTSSGDSSWLRDEIAEARAAGVPVVPLVEKGMKFEQGLFGNVEFIPFAPGHIGDVWIALTEALDVVRATRRHSHVLGDDAESES